MVYRIYQQYSSENVAIENTNTNSTPFNKIHDDSSDHLHIKVASETNIESEIISVEPHPTHISAKPHPSQVKTKSQNDVVLDSYIEGFF